MSQHHHQHSNGASCCQSQTNKSVVQTIDEMEFERGIWTAALYSDIPRLQSFIDKDKTNDCDNSGYTALHYAARNGNLEACQLLLSAGANVNAQTNGGVTALHRATMMGHLNIAKLLISRNANAAIQDSDGFTSLHRAVLNGNEEIVKFLINTTNAESLIGIKDNNGKKPIDLIADQFSQLKSLF